MDDMNDIYRQHAQTVYKFLLSQTRAPDLGESDLLPGQGKTAERRDIR